MTTSYLKNLAAKRARQNRRTNTYGTTKKANSQFANIISTHGNKRHLRDAHHGHKAAKAIHLAHAANYISVFTYLEENALCYGRTNQIKGTRYARNTRNAPIEEW